MVGKPHAVQRYRNVFRLPQHFAEHRVFALGEVGEGIEIDPASAEKGTGTEYPPEAEEPVGAVAAEALGHQPVISGGDERKVQELCPERIVLRQFSRCPLKRRRRYSSRVHFVGDRQHQSGQALVGTVARTVFGEERGKFS